MYRRSTIIDEVVFHVRGHHDAAPRRRLASCFGCDMVDDVKLAQSTVSEHLRILKSAGIISGEIEHPRVCYSLNPDSLMPLAALLNAVFEKDSRGELGGSICCPPSKSDPAKPRRN